MESPFKGKTGLRRVWNAFHYSLDGLGAAYRHEDAFRQEVWLAVVAIPLAVWLGEGALERALMIGCVLLVLIVELVNPPSRRRLTVYRSSATSSPSAQKTSAARPC